MTTQVMVIRNPNRTFTDMTDMLDQLIADNTSAQGPQAQGSQATETITYDEDSQELTITRVWNEDDWVSYSAANSDMTSVENYLQSKGWDWDETIT